MKIPRFKAESSSVTPQLVNSVAPARIGIKMEVFFAIPIGG